MPSDELFWVLVAESALGKGDFYAVRCLYPSPPVFEELVVKLSFRVQNEAVADACVCRLNSMTQPELKRLVANVERRMTNYRTLHQTNFGVGRRKGE